MKTLIKAIICLFLFSGSIHAQLNEKEKIIVKAMSDQLQYSMDSLKLENFPRPYFMQYFYQNGETNMLRYNRGSLIEEEIGRPINLIRTDIIVKDENGITNHNSKQRGFVVFPRMGDGQDRVPINPDYDETRRVFWWLSDVQYKNAISDYNEKTRKKTDPALAENVKKDMILPDFPMLEKVNYYAAPAVNPVDLNYWHELMKEVTVMYDDYPGLYDLGARLNTSCSDMYTITSEGTQMRHALTSISLNISIMVETKEKDRFSENLNFIGLTVGDLPSKQEIIAEVKEAIKLVLAMPNAETEDKEYAGPALIDALAVIDYKTLGGFAAYRTSVAGNNAAQNNNDNVGVRLCSSNISMKITPKLKEYKGEKILGSYEVDGEGVVPKDSLVLIEEGILKNLLNDRVPTLAVAESTGNNLFIGYLNVLSRMVMPAVLHVNCTDTKPTEDLKTLLIEKAKEEGLKYAFIVRKLKNGSTNWMYRVDVQDGSETLVSKCSLKLDANKPLRRTICTSDNIDVYHLNFWGVLNSIISPDAFLLEEVNVSKLENKR